jgi:FkbM family methyltransferase
MIKSITKSVFRSFGFDLKRYHPANSDAAQLRFMLCEHKVNLLLDVGANIGQYAKSVRQAGYRNRIVSFEPLSLAWQQLLNISKQDPLWEIAPRAAIGEIDGEVQINISGNSVSSSILNMLESHSKAAPDSSYVGSEKVPLRSLDAMSRDFLQPHSVTFLKIDTQGYEHQVLAGAKDLISQVVGIQLEMSIVPLYEGQKLFPEMCQYLDELGFSIWSLWPGFIEPTTGRLLQVDAVFFRN